MNKLARLCICIVAIVVVVMSFHSCKLGSDNIDSAINYTSQSVFHETDDGWYYYFIIEKVKNSSKTYYEFNAVNLKYREIPNYVINGYDENGNVVETMLPVPVSLYNGPETKNDIKKISKFFNTSCPDSILTLADMDTLDITAISKKTIVEYYNDALSSPLEQLGNYKDMQISNVVQESNSNDGYKWQVGYYLNYGNIKCFNIEIIYDDGTYLSDIDSAEAKATIEIIERIEEDVINSQSFNIDVSKYQVDIDIDFARLIRLINTL